MNDRHHTVRRRLTFAALFAWLAFAGGRPPLFAQGTPPAAPGTSSPAHGIVRIDTMWSQSLGIRKALRVYLPPSYALNSARRYPVLFYLHGLTGSEQDWTKSANINLVLDSLIASGQPEAIVAMPDGDDGWYTTWNTLPNVAGCRADTTRKEPSANFCVPWPHYDDYIARDLVSYVDKQYRTYANRSRRGIAGLSMGGYGAVTLALSYPDVFSAAASHSGVLAPLYAGPHPFAAPAQYARDSISLKKAVGWLWNSERQAFGADTLSWWAHDPGRLAARAKGRAGGVLALALRLDCGVDDPYVDQNRAFHQTLGQVGVSHEYAEWPGTHDWKYWRAHVPESLVFLLTHTRGNGAP